MESEINFVKNALKGTEKVLELGAGYGRIIKEIAPKCDYILGIDISEDNVEFSKDFLKDNPNSEIIQMDVHNVNLKDKFDVVLCLQNGISAMKLTVDDIKNIMNILADDGIFYISSYSNKFWDYRLKWFQEQSKKGLLGEIDFEKTKDGKIVCKDGFVGTTYTVEDFEEIGKLLGYPFEIKEVDESSLFLIIKKITRN